MFNNGPGRKKDSSDESNDYSDSNVSDDNW